MIVQARSMGEGPDVFLERIPGGDQEKVTLRATGWGAGVDAEDEAEWRRENRVGGRGESNAAGIKDRSKVASKNP